MISGGRTREGTGNRCVEERAAIAKRGEPGGWLSSEGWGGPHRKIEGRMRGGTTNRKDFTELSRREGEGREPGKPKVSSNEASSGTRGSCRLGRGGEEKGNEQKRDNNVEVRGILRFGY